MDRVLELRIPASPEFIAVVRLVVSSLVTARRELSDDRVDDLKLAVSEACTNAIEAHDAVSSEAAVTMRLWEDGDRIEVDIADEGPGFNPDAVPSHPPVTDPQRLNFERGLGIRLIRTLVDEVAFDSSAEGTTVRMVVYGGPADLGLDALAGSEAEARSSGG